MSTTALVQRLDELAGVVRTLTPDEYAFEAVPGVSGSVGAHVRHVLDHVATFVAADPADVLSYDHRDRGTTVERDPGAALRRIGELQRALRRIDLELVDAHLAVSTLLTPGGVPVVGWSSRGRELAFVISHTVHHQAIIALLLAVTGTTVPERFGYAPSTPSPDFAAAATA